MTGHPTLTALTGGAAVLAVLIDWAHTTTRPGSPVTTKTRVAAAFLSLCIGACLAVGVAVATGHLT